MKRLGLMFGLLGVLSGCGGNGALFLTIEGRGPLGDLRIPDDVDALAVVVTDQGGEKRWFDKQFPLDPAVHRFPLTLGLEQGEATASPIRLTVSGLRGEAVVAQSTTVTPFQREAVLSVTVRLETEE